MRIATWNVNSLKARLEKVVWWLERARPDVLLIYEMGGFLWKKPYRPVWSRPEDGGGMILGSAACFLVLEAREHAESRGATPLELQRLLAMVLADGNATAAAALLPEPVRSGALNQSITSLRRRVDR